MSQPDVTLCTIIGWIESRNDVHALRFELTVYEHVNETIDRDLLNIIKTINKCTFETAKIIFSMSFGAYQIMGFNLYDPALCECIVPIASYLNNAVLQDTTFNRYVYKRNIAYAPVQLLNKDNAIQFARVYNGSESYAQNIKSALNFFGVK